MVERVGRLEGRLESAGRQIAVKLEESGKALEESTVKIEGFRRASLRQVVTSKS